MTSLARLFEARVGADPGATAYVCEGRVATFAEINVRANRLAHRLGTLGVGPDVPVGAYLSRSIESAVALLAILKAGGAYVPLDPAYPVEQIGFMLADTGARAVVTSDVLRDRLPAVPVVTAGAGPDSDPRVATSPAHLSHIMYTSGSTGPPKGVLVPQRQLLHRFRWVWRAYPFEAGDVMCQRAGIGFSVSLWEFLGGLLRGVPTVLVPPEADRDPHALLDTLDRHRVTRLLVVPSMLRVLLSTGAEPFLPHVRQWTVCGEPLTRELFDRLRDLAPQAAICVDYGTTETNGFLWYDTGRAPSPRPTVPVGRPTAGMSVDLLDADSRPVPAGEPGYVHVRGPGVARGYLNRPELTAERFVPHGFRPGDLARLLPDGTVEYLGRTDNQVKIHGVRVELEGVEARLAEHPSVAHAVLSARDGVLVAHVVAASGADRDPAALRRYLTDRLPPAAVPTRYVFTEAIPLLPNGKVDRARLVPAAVSAGAGVPAGDGVLAGDGVPPRTDVQRRLAGAWAGVLQVPSVGLHDNFFDLGGDSLLTMQVVARCMADGLRFTPRQLTERPTIAALAPAVLFAAPPPASAMLPPGPVPLSPGQAKTLAHGWPEPHHWNAVTLRRIEPGADPLLLAEASRRLARHHDALRLRFARDGTGWRQWLVDDTEVFTRIGLSDAPDAIAAACAGVQSTLDLTKGPVARVVYLDLGPRRPGRVLIVVNHLAADAAASHLIREDFERLYVDLLGGGPGVLPAKTTSIREWASSLRADPTEVSYWSALPWQKVRPLPVDRPEATHASMTAGATEWFSPDEIRAVSRAFGVRVDELLLTVVARALAVWSGCPVQALDWIRHGRTPVAPDIDVSRTVGFFANYVPAVLEVDPGAGTATLARRVSAQLRRMPRDGIGYDLLGLGCPASEGCVNFVGQYRDSTAPFGPFGPADESPGPVRSPHNRFTTEHRLYFFARVDGDRLAFQYDYSPDVFRQATVDAVFRDAVADLRQTIGWGSHAQR